MFLFAEANRRPDKIYLYKFSQLFKVPICIAEPLKADRC